MKSGTLTNGTTSSQLLRIFISTLPNNLVENGPRHQLEFDALAECTCDPDYKDAGFNRLVNNRRKNTEDDIVSRAKKKFAAENQGKTVELNCLSMGSGKLLQDYIICAKLLLEGFSLTVNLIENMVDDEFQAALKKFKSLGNVASEKKLTFDVRHFKDVRDFLTQHPQQAIDIAWSIDVDQWDEEFEALCLIQNSLSKGGFFVFAGRGANAIFCNEQLKPEITNSDTRKVEAINYALEQYELGTLNPDFYYYISFLFIPRYCQQIKLNSTAIQHDLALVTGISSQVDLQIVLLYRGFLDEDTIRDPILFNMLIAMKQSIEDRKLCAQYSSENQDQESDTETEQETFTPSIRQSAI